MPSPPALSSAMLSTPRHVIASAWEPLRKVDGASAARACKVPVLFVNASARRPELELFTALCPQLMLGQTVGAGHFNMLEVTDQVNTMIERFLALNAREPPRCSPSLARGGGQG